MKSKDLTDKYMAVHSYDHACRLAETGDQAVEHESEAVGDNGEVDGAAASPRAARALCFVP